MHTQRLSWFGILAPASACPRSLECLLNGNRACCRFRKQTSDATNQTAKTCDPAYNQEFKFNIIDTKNARLECTLWDSSISLTEDTGSLGKVTITKLLTKTEQSRAYVTVQLGTI